MKRLLLITEWTLMLREVCSGLKTLGRPLSICVAMNVDEVGAREDAGACDGGARAWDRAGNGRA